MLGAVVGQRDIGLRETEPIVGRAMLQPPHDAPQFIQCGGVLAVGPPFPR
ncbi:MAG: hypothetical protein M3R24_16625 [Chloroflexota bacterium]|nr:hypothetical protein [Chloroflexota bacterium]